MTAEDVEAVKERREAMVGAGQGGRCLVDLGPAENCGAVVKEVVAVACMRRGMT